MVRMLLLVFLSGTVLLDRSLFHVKITAAHHTVFSLTGFALQCCLDDFTPRQIWDVIVQLLCCSFVQSRRAQRQELSAKPLLINDH
jgi:hypothetical protein